jgi:glycosyltransferase involved in cell wall biosynthesis
LHDAFAFPGGGERVAQCLAELTGAILWTAKFSQAAFPEGYFGDRPPMDMRGVERFPDLARLSETACFWKCFARFPKSAPPFAIFSGSLAPLAHKRITGKKILYCHTPPRILYDQRDYYLQAQSPAKRQAYKAFLWAFEQAYAKAARSMDAIVSNSQNVAHRLGRYLQLDSEIVPPPVSCSEFTWISQGDFFLSTARVDRLKRVELIVETFLALPQKRLVVVSGGSELERVKAMAKDAPNIEVSGWVSPEELRRLTGECLATVYIPRDEDFGISPVESMAAGKPVIGVAEGGLLETVREGRTGILIQANPDARHLAQAVAAMTPELALSMRPACEARARLFDEAAFREKMSRLVARVAG